MPTKEISRESDVDDVSEQLSDGLKTCRSVVANYKALLAGDGQDTEAPEEAESKEPGAAASAD